MAHLFDTSAIHPAALELGRIFAERGYELSLVGGPVRDLFLGAEALDLDFTTDATPDQILETAGDWADAHWEIGREYGTIGLRKGEAMIEVTTYRAEAYDADSRKPTVAFGRRLEDDLFRRDFTINSMALRLPGLELVDPYGGIRDLHAGILRTPGAPEDSFSDDPLRMMRAARFASRLDVAPAPEVVAAMTDMAERIGIVSAERVRDELVKLMVGRNPRRGVDLLVSTGLADHVLPEVPALRMQRDEAHQHKDVYEHSLTVLMQAADLETGPEGPVPAPDFTLRFAALMHDVGKPATRRLEEDGAVSFRHHDVVGAKLVKKRMRALRFDNETIRNVARLVELHMRFYGYGDAGWTDSAVRRYVRDAGDQLQRLHRLTRSDVTTRNQRKAGRLRRAYDDLERRIEQLAAQEEMDAMRPDLDGEQIMAILGIAPGPTVGKAYRFLLELRLDEGSLGEEETRRRLLAWWAQQPESDAGADGRPGVAGNDGTR